MRDLMGFVEKIGSECMVLDGFQEGLSAATIPS